MMYHVFQPLEINEETLAFSATRRVGRAPFPRRRAHARALPRVLLPAARLIDRNYGAGTQWRSRHATRANEVWKKTLEEYEEPPMDSDLKAELKRMWIGDEPS